MTNLKTQPRKKYCLSAEEIKPVAEGYGACFATDRITVNGDKIGYMYREEPDNDIDSGWRFLSGSEDDEYMDESENHGIYDVNTIANYDPAIIQFLDAPIGSTFVRDEDTGEFFEISE